MKHILKTKLFYFLLICIAAGVMVTQSPGNLMAIDPKQGVFEHDQPTTRKCVDIKDFNVTYSNNVTSSNANILDLNCHDNTIIHIDIQFDWKQWICFYPSICDYYVQFIIDGVLIGRQKVEKDQSNFTESINMSKFGYLDELAKGSKNLTVKVISQCGQISNVLAQQSLPIQIINSAELSSSFYTTTQWIKDRIAIICDKTQKAFCCAKEPSCACIIFKRENIDQKFKETIDGKNFQSFSLKMDVKGDMYGVGAGGGISTQYEWTNTVNAGFRYNYKTTILAENKLCPEPGESFYPMWKYEEACYQEVVVQANCDGEGKIISRGAEFCLPKLDAAGNLFLLPYNSKECAATIAEDCKKPRPSAIFASNSGFFRNNCTGNLTVTDLGEGVDPATTQVWWTDQNGTMYAGPNHTNVPIGTYTLHIKNECCDYWTKQYRVCDNPVDGPWIKQGEQYCKEVTCGGCSYTECVTPDRVEDEFDQNQKKCIKEYYHQNQLLGTTL